MRYSPGSLVIIAGPAGVDPDRFADRVVEERGAVLSLAKVRALLAGRVPADQIEAKAVELLDTAVQKRLAARQSVVVPVEGLDPEGRERFVRPAHAQRRPRHLILVDGSREQVTDDERPVLDELRRALDAGELGREGFQTVMRLGGQTRDELKRIVFARPPADE
jgi:predicted kinase